MTATATEAQFTNYITSQPTDMLFKVLDMLEAKGNKATEDEKFSKVAVIEAIEARHNLDGAMDAIYSDDTFKGTYVEALKIAYNQK